MSSASQSFFDGSGKPALGRELVGGSEVGAGRYVLKHVLGQGGMGVVWLAHDRLLRESVALKFVAQPLCLDPIAMEGLRKETLQARKLSHPNIIRIHDLVDQSGEALFITMEHVDGSNLHNLRARHPNQVLSWKYLLPLLRQLCQALAYAHGERIIHRDIKPANLMIDRSGRLKLADFGLARIASDSMTRSSHAGFSSGTLDYMSPQQADGRRSEVSDDLYSVGATFYELLTSTPPFFRGDVQYQLRHNQPQPLQERLADQELSNAIPDHVCALILACLQKDPAARPESADAILQCIDAENPPDATLGSAAPGEPVPQHTPRQPPTQRLDTRFAIGSDQTGNETSIEPRRISKWRIAGAAAGIVIATVGSVVVSTSTSKVDSNSRPNSNSKSKVEPGVPAGPAVEPGFRSLFNGRDLTGWEGDRELWAVRDGVITATTTEEGIKRRENTCLIWHEPVDNFELRLSFRLRDVITAKPANSGVLYRARRLEDFQVRGFQADLHDVYTGTLLLLEGKNDVRTGWGHRSVITETAHGPAIVSQGVITPQAKMKTAVQSQEWNELVIVAQGDHLRHMINGTVTAEVLDRSRYVTGGRGVLAFELKRATMLEFKDIRLKKLPPRDQARVSAAGP